MLNVHFSDRYVTAHDLLLEEDSFYEDVVAEASVANFHLTCSIGIDKKDCYMTWNLRYNNIFLHYKKIPLQQVSLNIFNRKELEKEATYKFRQFVWKTANCGGEEAIAAQKLVHSWTFNN